MQKILKSAAAIFTAMLMVFSCTSLSVRADDGVNVTLNNMPATFEQKPRIINGRTMVPLRSACGVLGIELYWDASSNTAYLSSGDIKASHRSGTTSINVNGSVTSYDTASRIIAGRIFMPLKMLADMVGAKADYVKASNTVALTYDLGGYSVTVGSKTVTTGDNVTKVKSAFGEPQRISPTAYAYEWYSYGAGTDSFVLIGMLDGLVRAFYTNAKTFSYNGSVKYGDMIPADKSDKLTFFTDKFNGNKVYAVYVNQCKYEPSGYTSSFAVKSAGEELTVADLTNTFRFNYGVSACAYSNDVAKVAKKHSADMADNNYFAHSDLNGGTSLSRLKAANVFLKSCSENIAGGNMSAVMTFDQWVNTETHRQAMLKPEFTHIGVGIAYNSASNLKYYYTQSFINASK